MTSLDHDHTLRRAGANVSGRVGWLLFLARRYPLGAVGALIVVLFVTTAVFADALTSFDPFTTNPRASLAPPGGAHALGADFMGPCSCRVM